MRVMKTTCKLKGNVTCYLKEATLQKGFCRHISGSTQTTCSLKEAYFKCYLKMLLNLSEVSLCRNHTLLKTFYVTYLKDYFCRSQEPYLKKFSEDILWRRRLKFSVRETVWREVIEYFWKKISEAKRKASWSRKS